MEVNLHHAKTHLSRLIEQALAGNDIVIANAGAPLVRLVRMESDKPKLGIARGQIQLKDGWDDSLTDRENDALFGS